MGKRVSGFNSSSVLGASLDPFSRFAAACFSLCFFATAAAAAAAEGNVTLPDEEQRSERRFRVEAHDAFPAVAADAAAIAFACLLASRISAKTAA
jgi:hypothetical protein